MSFAKKLNRIIESLHPMSWKHLKTTPFHATACGQKTKVWNGTRQNR